MFGRRRLEGEKRENQFVVVVVEIASCEIEAPARTAARSRPIITPCACCWFPKIGPLFSSPTQTISPSSRKEKRNKKEKKADVYRRRCEPGVYALCLPNTASLGKMRCVDSQSVSIETAERCRLYRAIVFGSSSDQTFLLSYLLGGVTNKPQINQDRNSPGLMQDSPQMPSHRHFLRGLRQSSSAKHFLRHVRPCGQDRGIFFVRSNDELAGK